MIRRIITVCFISSFICSFSLYAQENQSKETKRVLLAFYVMTPQYQSIVDTFKENVKNSSAKSKFKIEYDTLEVEGDREAFIASLNEHDENGDVIFTVGALNATAIKESGVSLPVVFAGVRVPLPRPADSASAGPGRLPGGPPWLRFSGFPG